MGAYVSVEDKRPRASVRDERLAAQLRPGWRGLHEEKMMAQIWKEKWGVCADVEDLVRRTKNATGCDAVLVCGLGADDKENMGDAVWWKQLALARADVVIEMHRTHASGDWWDGWSEHGLRPVVTTVTRMDLLATAAGQVLLRDMSRPTRGGRCRERGPRKPLPF